MRSLLHGRKRTAVTIALALGLPCLAAGAPLPSENHGTTRSAAMIEVGEIAGAPFRIDVPVGWNGGLLMYCHGYRGAPVRFDAHTPDAMAQTFAPLGYAVAQSGYSAGGYAVREAIKDTEALRVYFGSHFGPPKETWVSGSSLGGSVTMMLLESYPTTYDGGLALSAPLGPTLDYGKTLTFDQLAVFEYLLPGHCRHLRVCRPIS